MEGKDVDIFHLLPQEILDMILSRMEPSDLCRMCLVCAGWREKISSSVVWRKLCARDGILVKDRESAKTRYCQLAPRLKLLQDRLAVHTLDRATPKSKHPAFKNYMFRYSAYSDKTIVAYASGNPMTAHKKRIYVWNTETGQVTNIHTLPQELSQATYNLYHLTLKDGVVGLHFLGAPSDPNSAAAADRELISRIQLWSLDEWECLFNLEFVRRGYLSRCVDFSVRHELVAFINPDPGTRGTLLTVYSTATGDCLASVPNRFKNKNPQSRSTTYGDYAKYETNLILMFDPDFTGEEEVGVCQDTEDAMTRKRCYYVAFKDGAEVVVIKMRHKDHQQVGSKCISFPISGPVSIAHENSRLHVVSTTYTPGGDTRNVVGRIYDLDFTTAGSSDNFSSTDDVDSEMEPSVSYALPFTSPCYDLPQWSPNLCAEKTNILGVGAKFMLLGTCLNELKRTVYVCRLPLANHGQSNNVSAKLISKRVLEDDDDYAQIIDCCGGDSGWLSGLDGENDTGTVFIQVVEHPHRNEVDVCCHSWPGKPANVN